ncbi:pseudouridylate synthase [Dyadobacter sp. CY326]|uniref:pseudouridylate synthase n=1 Tax=Dyadobacter sp. CY326 TaxID=2907300 RepID=UPI001F2191EE|nr:pseudouridylate synthase [Dyadobacter sp. CY326]MCE7064990.1 pseudouridylate synthase [Dyadobacter sp. CY326]
MLNLPILTADTYFTPFEKTLAYDALPKKFPTPFAKSPHPLTSQAVSMLQAHVQNQQDWAHNFGLTNDEVNIIGKMFGVLVVQTEQNEIGYLSAFSGKLAGANHHSRFVPPLFDGVAAGGFLNAGMTELSRINDEISMLEAERLGTFETQIRELKVMRKAHSLTLQNQIFDQYHFLNQTGKQKSLREIFSDAGYKNPPAGAGECAAPKLLQYAFQQNMKPLAIAEFWWGQSPKSAFWKHREFYPSCREKCAPILAHMLSGMELEHSHIICD